MAKKICTELGRIATLETDMKWLKQSLSEIVPKINEMYDMQKNSESDVAIIQRTLYGNGNKEDSIVFKIGKHETFMTSYESVRKTIIYLIGATGINMIILIGFFLKFSKILLNL